MKKSIIAAIIVGIIIAGILISSAFTFSQDVETDVSPSEETDVSPSEEPADTTPPSVEPTQGRQLHLEFNESMAVAGTP